METADDLNAVLLKGSLEDNCMFDSTWREKYRYAGRPSSDGSVK